MVIARAASQAMRWSSRVVSIEVLIESWCGDALLLTGVGLVYLRSEVDAVKARTRALDAHEDAIGQPGGARDHGSPITTRGAGSISKCMRFAMAGVMYTVRSLATSIAYFNCMP